MQGQELARLQTGHADREDANLITAEGLLSHVDETVSDSGAPGRDS